MQIEAVVSGTTRFLSPHDPKRHEASFGLPAGARNELDQIVAFGQQGEQEIGGKRSGIGVSEAAFKAIGRPRRSSGRRWPAA